MLPGMPDTLDTIQRGLEVELAAIEKSLAALWAEDVATRASLVNLAIYSENPQSPTANSQLISALTRQHACRAILINSNPNAPRAHIRAWINAHCHVTRAGAKQVCCEQISFQIDGEARNFLPNIVFAHLDSDLPLYFWWQGEFDPDLCREVWGWVDRLLYDNRDWSDPRAQFAFLKSSIIQPRLRVALCDLDWTRIVYLRQGLAQLFDHPEAAAQVHQIARVEIVHNAAARSTALLLAGWLAAQLNWNPTDTANALSASANRTLRFTNPARDNGGVEIHLKTSEDTDAACISRLALHAPALEVALERHASAPYFNATLRLGGECHIAQTLPAGREALADVLNEELVRGGRHRVYVRALEKLGFF